MADPVDLDLLDRYLLSDEAPDNGMGLSDLDGFLTGILVGPELIMPSEWLPRVWGGEAPKFANEEQARLILSTIMGRYNEIAASLEAGPTELDPVFWEHRDGDRARGGLGGGLPRGNRVTGWFLDAAVPGCGGELTARPYPRFVRRRRRQRSDASAAGHAKGHAGGGTRAHPRLRVRHPPLLARAGPSSRARSHHHQTRTEYAVPMRVGPQIQALLRRQLARQRD